jgi:uncharacterized membrane protein (UPF0127 family)
MTTPSKSELKAKYKIANDDFEILTELPSLSTVKEKRSLLVLLTATAGAQEWMWKTPGGIVLAIIIVSLNVAGWVQTLQPIASYACNRTSEALAYLLDDADQAAQGSILLLPEDKPQSIEYLSRFPNAITAGTSVVPVSGTWRV